MKEESAVPKTRKKVSWYKRRNASRALYAAIVVVIFAMMIIVPAALANKGDAPQQYGNTPTVAECDQKAQYSKCPPATPTCKQQGKKGRKCETPKTWCKKHPDSKKCKSPAKPKPAPAPTPVPPPAPTPVVPEQPVPNTPAPTPPTPPTSTPPPAVTIGQPTLTLNKTANRRNVVRNQVVVFTLRVTNTSSVVATNVVLQDFLPSGMVLKKNPSGSRVRSNVITWKVSSIAPGATVERKIAVMANFSYGRCRANKASVRAPGFVPDDARSTICVIANLVTGGSGGSQPPVAG